MENEKTLSIEVVETVVKESQKPLVDGINETKIVTDSIKSELETIKTQINTLATKNEDELKNIKLSPEEIKFKKNLDFLNFCRDKFRMAPVDEKNPVYADAPIKNPVYNDATMTTTNTYTSAPQYDLGIEGSISTSGLARNVGQTKSLVSNVFHMLRITGSAVAYVVGEGNSTTQSQVCPVDVQIPGVANTVLLKLTKENIAFANPYDLESLVNDEVIKAMGLKEDMVAMSGSAAGLYGIYTDTAVNTFQQSATASLGFAPTQADLDNFEHTLDPTVRANAIYFVGTDHLAKIKNVNTSGSHWAYDSVTDTINGKKYVEFSSGVLTAATTVTTGSKMVAFGDPNKLWFADNGTIEVTADPYTGAATRTLNFYFTKLFSFGLRNPSCFVVWKI